MITEERKQEILATVTPEIQSQELVQDGTENNYRPLVLIYTANDYVVTETRNYCKPPNDAGWNSCSSTYESEVNNG